MTAPGLLLPFRGSHPLTLGFRATTLELEPPMWFDRAGGKPWRARAEPFAAATKVPHFHSGDDYGMPEGTKLYAPAAGRIVDRGSSARGGRYVTIKIAGRNTWIYLGHLEGWALPSGAAVDAGELVAYSGATGHVTGPHVHFGVTHGKDNPRIRYNPRRLLVGGDEAATPWIVPAA